MTQGEILSKLLSTFLRLSALTCVPGGVLWALSPLGVHFSELKFKTPNVFWKLFPSAPLLLLIGAIGLHFWLSGRYGRLGKAGLVVLLLGLTLVIAGDAGLYWLQIDNTYIMSAPAYRTFRIGLLILGIGSVIYGVANLWKRTLPDWASLPFTVGAVCGLASFVRDSGQFGATLWVMYGAGWAWLGISLLIDAFASFLRNRRAGSQKPLTS